MQTADLEPIHWSTCAFVSVAQAAQIVARSPDWVRSKVGEGRLEAARHSAGGPLVIVVPSLQRLIKTVRPVSPAELLERRPARSRPRLVINNE